MKCRNSPLYSKRRSSFLLSVSFSLTYNPSNSTSSVTYLKEAPERYDVRESQRGTRATRAHERPNGGLPIEQVVELVDRLALIALHVH